MDFLEWIIDFLFGGGDSLAEAGGVADMAGATEAASTFQEAGSISDPGQTSGGDVMFGNSVGEGRFDVPGALSENGNNVISDAAGNLRDGVTGDPLSPN